MSKVFLSGYKPLDFPAKDDPNRRIKGYNLFLCTCLLYTSPSPRDPKTSRMPSSA